MEILVLVFEGKRQITGSQTAPIVLVRSRGVRQPARHSAGATAAWVLVRCPVAAVDVINSRRQPLKLVNEPINCKYIIVCASDVIARARLDMAKVKRFSSLFCGPLIGELDISRQHLRSWACDSRVITYRAVLSLLLVLDRSHYKLLLLLVRLFKVVTPLVIYTFPQSLYSRLRGFSP
ncbi:hypothetical protein EVAR_48981_1 [Eumeta japonica]|uniref:Uncharacterized protein n=1 Tax=Eumeta variegata TaxID=151549 RepID=A0A4C1ZZK4_EUMVA|nr:hypothetical protein EVAR_48981_1 [Eumeta japonica]